MPHLSLVHCAPTVCCAEPEHVPVTSERQQRDSGGLCGPHPQQQQQAEQGEGAKNPRKAVQYWPLVQFAEGGEARVMEAEIWEVEKNARRVATRTQVPLTLAWALSVHKCQGMTLDRVDTNLSRAFDYGMVYVALSRVRRLEGLHLSGFDPRKIRVHEKVAAFYDDLQRQSCLDLEVASGKNDEEDEEEAY